MRRKAIYILVVFIHVNLSSILVAYNDNDNHDQRNSPVELRYYVIEFIIVFIYPHGGTYLFYCDYKCIRVSTKKQYQLKILMFRNHGACF